MLGKPCGNRLVIAGFVMECNCSQNVVSAYPRLGEVTQGWNLLRSIGNCNEECQSLVFVIVMPHQGRTRGGWLVIVEVG